MSDSLGNLLFYSDGDRVWNKNGEIMDNGENILPGGSWDQSAISFPRPGSADQYYLFTVSDWISPKGFYYSIIDMSLNGGLGAVTNVKNIELEAAFWAHDHQNVTKSRSGDAYWVVTRLYHDDRYASFLVDEQGVHTDPVISSTGIYREFLYDDGGNIKISPDKKYLVNGHRAGTIGIEEKYLKSFEVCTFNDETGEIEYLYMINRKNIWGSYEPAYCCEFSPDSKYLYLTFEESDSGYLYQYDMQYIQDSTAFVNSAIEISNQSGVNIQLSNDGKIYTSLPTHNFPNYQYYIGVINKPWERGLNCDFDPNGIYLLGRVCEWGLPNILLDYLYRFEWEADNYCQGTPVQFLPNFVPTPDSIEWNFDEFGPGNISYELSPTYTFQFPGTHEVKVDIWYPTGRYEHTSREIEIYPVPHPDLGPDLTICEGNTVTLNANCEADLYSWSTGQFGSPTITVSDSGTYWVRASFNETGCSDSDTVHVGFYPPIQINESALVVTPTTCNGATGSITGLAIEGTEPMQYQWEDLSGNNFGTDIDVFNLSAGQYVLTVTDANGCETASSVYTIEDAGNLQVTQVQTISPHCFRPDGQLIISAFSPSGSSLEYSVDDGASYASDSIFTDLPAGTYIVRIRDINGCDGFYIGNPVILSDIPGPQVQPPVVTDETDFLGNGSIEIVVTGSTTQIFYSINNGSNWQTNNGTFNNLQAGSYICVVKDENDCDTTFVIEIQNIILTYLHAVTGEGGHCLDNTALVAVNVDNFTSVADFHLKLGYNADNLQCEGFTNVHPQLVDSLTGWVDQAAGEINLAWNSLSPVTFALPETILDLVFTTKNPGQGDLSWYIEPSVSYFTNASGNPIPAEFSTGEVIVYEPPEIILSASKTVCEGQMFSLMSIASGNQPPISYRWTYPSGDTSDIDPFIFNVTSSDAGFYTLLATDIVGCTDQKSIQLIVSENPVATFHGTDTLEMNPGEVLDAGSGLSSYLWNTGDTTESIVINSEGKFKVEMESSVGCTGSDSVYIKLTSEEIPETNLFIPNAFTPDGNGINDTFSVSHFSLSLEHFTMSIFDRWGGLIFESNDILVGWDGKKNGNPCPGGVYVYKIIFTVDGIPGNQERVGTVALVK
ncbi:MAG: gliding motility-associated C-terminal domain-containing protein [Bacteroidales bacterium]|nr:gliding motility-associated C-terminal domain-containing protein [Bacteroidales bacterium]